MMEQKELTALCKELEFFETDLWTIDAILEKEKLTECVLEPCCGDGRLVEAAIKTGARVYSYDIHDWGYRGLDEEIDFLKSESKLTGMPFTVFMNPPFSLATDFVEHSFELGAKKVICFQRFAWYESQTRRDFWDKFPPVRVWVCGDRATCWRHDLPSDEKGNRYDPDDGKKLAGTSTAHAWFIFNRGNKKQPRLGRIYKNGKHPATAALL